MNAPPLKVLVIDDEPPIRKLLRVGLGFREVRIDREDRGDPRREVIAHVTAYLSGAAIADIVMADQRIRCYLQTNTLFESIHASERTDAGKIEDRCIEAKKRG